MREVEWSASSSETNPMLRIGRQSGGSQYGLCGGLSRPTFAQEGWTTEVQAALMTMVAASGLALIKASWR